MNAAGIATRPRGVRAIRPCWIEERLVDVLDRLGLLAHGDRQRRQPDRSAAELLAQRAEHGPVDLVEAELVDAEHGQAALGGGGVDAAVAADLGEVAHATQQPVGDPRRARGRAGRSPTPRPRRC